MLYNRKWEQPKGVFTLESLTAWLEQQPADKTYLFIDSNNCLLCQYFSAMGLGDVNVTGREMYLRDETKLPLPAHFGDIARGDVSDDWAQTFGAALARARKVMAKTRAPAHAR